MNPEATSEVATETTFRPAVVTLPPKRRMRIVQDTPVVEMPLPTPEPSPVVRRARMRRSGRMPVRWRGQETPAAWISPEILTTFNEAIGAIGKTSPKQLAHAAA